MNKLLEVSGLHIAFEGRDFRTTAVSDVSFHVMEGETLGIVGESGCGKSVTSLSLMGLLPPHGKARADKLMLAGQSLLALPETEIRQIRGNRMSMIFQEPMTSLNPVIPVGKQIEEVLTLHTRIGRKEKRTRTVDMLRKVGIARPEAVYRQYPHELSGGMRQRVMIAMALICGPQLLIADEPTTALDVTIQAQMLDLMRGLQQEADTAILLITHDLGVVAEMCNRVLVMYAGEVVEESDVVSLFTEPKHPYTLGLLQSLPQVDQPVRRLASIPGRVPALDDMPAGCRFAPRCPSAGARCLSEAPELLRFGGERACRCWLYAEGGVGLAVNAG